METWFCGFESLVIEACLSQSQARKSLAHSCQSLIIKKETEKHYLPRQRLLFMTTRCNYAIKCYISDRRGDRPGQPDVVMSWLPMVELILTSFWPQADNNRARRAGWRSQECSLKFPLAVGCRRDATAHLWPDHPLHLERPCFTFVTEAVGENQTNNV